MFQISGVVCRVPAGGLRLAGSLQVSLVLASKALHIKGLRSRAQKRC